MKYHCFTLETKTKVTWNYTINDHPVKGYFHSPSGIYFHLIPKNASSFLSGHSADLGWDQITNVDQLQFKKGLAIIRDAISRWVSGIVEFFYINNLINQNFKNDWAVYKNLLIHNPIQDGHTSPRQEFLLNMDLEKFKFVFMPENQNINAKVQTWLANNGYSNSFNKYERQNKSTDSTEKIAALNIVKDTLTDRAFKDALRTHFSTSYELIDWINRNNKWI